MSDVTAAILWDASHLWGLMAHRSMAALGVPHSFIMAQEIAQGALFRKRPAVLLVPGGSARQKACALGEKGLAAIREWVALGGFYLGFCGGAGLALSEGAQDGLAGEAGKITGLGLCPWHRRAFRDRIYHLVSGHVLARTIGGVMALPVWWPGRFEEEGSGDVQVLARYAEPGADLWLADLPLASVPAGILQQWRDWGWMDASRVIKAGQPLVISGNYGKGGYVLSYAHLETPNSPEANSLLAHILAEKARLRPKTSIVAPWRIPAVTGEAAPDAAGAEAPLSIWRGIMRLGHELGFFFERTPWLQGWRRGAPGMGCNHLLACLDALNHMRPGPEMGTQPDNGLWEAAQEELAELFAGFGRETEICFWNLRINSTLEEKNACGALEAERNRLFGHPMLGGGQIQRLLSLLEKLIYHHERNLSWDYPR